MKYLPTSGLLKGCHTSEFSEINYNLKEVIQEKEGVTLVIGFAFTPIDIQRFTFRVFSDGKTKTVCAPYIHGIDASEAGMPANTWYTWTSPGVKDGTVPFLQFPKTRDGVALPLLLGKILDSQGPLHMHFYVDEHAYRGASAVPASILAEIGHSNSK